MPTRRPWLKSLWIICAVARRGLRKLLSADFTDTTGSIDKLLNVLEVLGKISMQQYEQAVGMHQIVQGQADYLKAGIQTENSPKASPLQSLKKGAHVSGGEASKSSPSALSLTALDEATRCLCRNERFYWSSTAPVTVIVPISEMGQVSPRRNRYWWLRNWSLTGARSTSGSRAPSRLCQSDVSHASNGRNPTAAEPRGNV